MSHDTKTLAYAAAADPIGWCQACWAIHEAAGYGGPHFLVAFRTHLGDRRFHASAGNCACGERFRDDSALSKGGRKRIEAMHKEHVAEPVLEEEG